MRIAIFAMMASAMGTGIFNLPLRIQQVGLGSYLFYVFISFFFSYTGTKMLTRMIKTQGY